MFCRNLFLGSLANQITLIECVWFCLFVYVGCGFPDRKMWFRKAEQEMGRTKFSMSDHNSGMKFKGKTFTFCIRNQKTTIGRENGKNCN